MSCRAPHNKLPEMTQRCTECGGEDDCHTVRYVSTYLCQGGCHHVKFISQRLSQQRLDLLQEVLLIHGCNIHLQQRHPKRSDDELDVPSSWYAHLRKGHWGKFEQGTLSTAQLKMPLSLCDNLRDCASHLGCGNTELTRAGLIDHLTVFMWSGRP